MLRRLPRIRVERKMVLLMLLVGVLPLGVAAFVALQEIERQTLALAEKQLREATKTYSLDLFDQLDHAAWEMRLLHLGEIEVDRSDLVETLTVSSDLLPLERPRLAGEPESLRLLFDQGTSRLEGTIDPDELFQGLGHVPAGVERCVVADDVEIRCAGNLSRADIGEGLVEVAWTLPLSSVYETDVRMAIRSRQSSASALKHVSLFAQLLPLLLLLVITLVAWTLSALIRRRMAPLAELEAATVAIREGRYDTSVDIDSADEFEKLGQAFNLMTRRLERSFTKMEGLAEIDRSILDGNDVDEVIKQALCLAGEYYGRTCVAYLWEEHVKQGRLFNLDGSELEVTPLCLVAPPGEDRSRVDHRKVLGEMLDTPLVDRAPIRVDNAVAGELMLMADPSGSEVGGDFATLAELADRISVAATNRAQARSLYRQANYDTLTGLLNRQAFSDRVADAVRRSARLDQRGAILFLDLDRFKRVNDTAGHRAGDELLRVIADRLSNELRDTDTVARLGGDEFAVILPDCGSDTLLTGLCGRIIETVNEPVEIEGLRHEVDVSVGVSIFPDDGQDVGTLLMKADVAMYEAKAQSGSTFSFYDSSLNEENERRVLIESGLRGALTDGNLVLHYQPKLDLSSMRICGVEGLLRWKNGDALSYSPAEFIPVAEETGLIHRFTELLIDEAARCIVQCRLQNLDPGRIALNISTRQFVRQGFARSFLAVLESSEIGAEDVEIEITESLFIEDAEHVTQELKKLREAGVRVALDDFGTGFSSLNMLRSLPLDTVKIDRSFISPIRDAADARKVTQKIIEMVTALKMEVVAEGVEHWQEVSLLDRLGCHQVQGYVLEKPMPLEALVAYLERVKREGIRGEYRVVGSD
ncbi:MAG: EAL domain-containing protein [Pseudomonadales bacterium]